MTLNARAPKFCTRYNGVKKVLTVFEKPSLTDQSFKDESDINFIIENYLRTGKGLNNSTMSYQDCTSVNDYQEAMYLVAEAKSNFESLPSKERDRFKTVENYLEFISNRDNLKESYEKGYIDQNSVDLADIYPERFKTVIDDIKPVEEASNTVSSNDSDSSKEAG